MLELRYFYMSEMFSFDLLLNSSNYLSFLLIGRLFALSRMKGKCSTTFAMEIKKKDLCHKYGYCKVHQGLSSSMYRIIVEQL